MLCYVALTYVQKCYSMYKNARKYVTVVMVIESDCYDQIPSSSELAESSLTSSSYLSSSAVSGTTAEDD